MCSRSGVFFQLLKNSEGELILAVRVTVVASKTKDVAQQAMNACSLHAKPKLLAHAQNRLQLLTGMRIILSLHHRLAEIHRAAKPIIFQMQTFGLFNSSSQRANGRRLRAPIREATRARFVFRD